MLPKLRCVGDSATLAQLLLGVVPSALQIPLESLSQPKAA